jgi:hypothetical protein
LGKSGPDFSKTSCIVCSAILTLAADAHAERKSRILKQRECLLHTGVVSTLQRLYRFFNLRTHRLNPSRKTSGTSAWVTGEEPIGCSPRVLKLKTVLLVPYVLSEN